MSIKAIVVDIDGTLTDMNKLIFTSGIEALRKVQEKGIPVSLASGNVLPVAYGLSTYLGLRGPIVAENGGVVSHQERIYQVAEGILAERAYEHLRSRMPVERLFTDRWRCTEVALRRTADLERVRKELEGWDVTIEATGFAIHIMDRGHGKLAGVRKMAEISGIDISQIITGRATGRAIGEGRLEAEAQAARPKTSAPKAAPKHAPTEPGA